MPRVFCNVSTCGHYKDNYCCISPVRVTGKNAASPNDTCCESYIDGRTHKDRQQPEQNACIDCEATNCVFNNGSRCGAQSVDIAGENAYECRQTECRSFQL